VASAVALEAEVGVRAVERAVVEVVSTAAVEADPAPAVEVTAAAAQDKSQGVVF